MSGVEKSALYDGPGQLKAMIYAETMTAKVGNRISETRNSLIVSYSITRNLYECPSAVTMKDTVKPVCNDHLYNEIYYLWFIH